MITEAEKKLLEGFDVSLGGDGTFPKLEPLVIEPSQRRSAETPLPPVARPGELTREDFERLPHGVLAARGFYWYQTALYWQELQRIRGDVLDSLRDLSRENGTQAERATNRVNELEMKICGLEAEIATRDLITKITKSTETLNPFPNGRFASKEKGGV